MNEKPLIKWILANALGLGIGFVAILQTGMLIQFGLNWRLHWTWVEQPIAQDATQFFSSLVSMLVGAAFLGSIQALILRSHSIPVIRWILATTAGFGIVVVIVSWPLIALGVLGAIPGPVEPIIITVGGSSFAGVMQYFTLRRQGIPAFRWLLLWVGGLLAGIVPTALLMISLETWGLAPSWPLEVFLNGLIIAGVAAAISGNALFSAFSEFRDSEMGNGDPVSQIIKGDA